MLTFLLVVQALVAVLLVGVILMQQSEGGGLGMGGSPSGLMSARGAADFLTRSTAILAAVFIGLSILHAVLAAQTNRGGDVDTSLAKPIAPAPAAPAPATGAPTVPIGSAPQPVQTAPAAPVVPMATAQPKPQPKPVVRERPAAAQPAPKAATPTAPPPVTATVPAPAPAGNSN